MKFSCKHEYIHSNVLISPDSRLYFSLDQTFNEILEYIETLNIVGDSLNKIVELWNIDPDLQIELRE